MSQVGSVNPNKGFIAPSHNRQVKDAGRDRPARAKDGLVELKKSPIRDPKKVLQSFNTWAFKREQPSDAELMLEVVAKSIQQGRPIPFVLYWGKGPRCELAEPDIKCLDYLSAMVQRIREAYGPAAAVTLIFTDTHAALNGHDPDKVAAYFEAVGVEARERGFETCRLSELTQAAEAASVEPDDERMTEAMLTSLSACAAKWFRGEGTSTEGALRYYQANMLEKRAVEHAFPDSIFVTFNGSDYRSLFPARMPIFYMYSLQRGVGVKPWFIGEAGPACQAA